MQMGENSGTHYNITTIAIMTFLYFRETIHQKGGNDAVLILGRPKMGPRFNVCDCTIAHASATIVNRSCLAQGRSGNELFCLVFLLVNSC